MTTWESVYEVIGLIRRTDDMRPAGEMFAARFGRRLSDLTPDKAMEVMYRAARTQAGMSLADSGGRFSDALLRTARRTPRSVGEGHAGAWLAANAEREGKA